MVKVTRISKPKLTVCRHDGGIVHVTIDGYEIVKTKDRTTMRVADVYLYEDGFVSGHLSSFDEDGRCIRSRPMDDEECMRAVRKFDLWYYASVA